MPALNEIYARITKVLVHALGVEEGDIKPSATLQGDPGAESIDFLDITFRLKREVGIKIPLGELFPEPASRDAPAFTRRPTDRRGPGCATLADALGRLEGTGARPPAEPDR